MIHINKYIYTIYKNIIYIYIYIKEHYLLKDALNVTLFEFVNVQFSFVILIGHLLCHFFLVFT